MENKSFDKIDWLLREKSYEALNKEEKQLADEQLGGEKAYQDLRSLILLASSEPERKTAPQTKQALLALFKQKHRPAWLGIFAYKIPAYASAAIVILAVALAFLFTPEKERVVEKIVSIPTTPVIDTVIVAQHDTVYLEKVVEKTIYLTANPKEEKNTAPVPKIITSKPMAEQEELKSFLVESD